ncbi:unnamed protein product [Caenorhabditis bovis]|uniref:ubiquitinyl hydrolase 1 n=1 Tax=Caenorhabditis bovis TaxID=2654633 RepID=A0A8S1F2V9_9PELO|nr:unnamed protein product [Caenorhabditis bovis]
MKKSTVKKKDRPNQRQIAFRQEAVNALIELKDEGQVTFEKAIEVAKLDCRQCKLHDVPHNPKHQNCRDNPFCIHRLGIEKFDKLLSKELERREEVKKDQKRRDLNDQPAGLINTGNFCYVNSFLQVWFNEIKFRQIVYDFRPSTHYVVPPLPRMNVQEVMLALQDLFYTLDTTPFFDTNKNDQLIKALRLGSDQQDTQEFTLMLFDALDRNLEHHPNGKEIQKRIRNLYTGMTTSRIACQCGMASVREERSTSLQLNIDGYSTLLDALNAYYRVEKLDDYRCSECNRTGCVTKEIDYTLLPPVLIIQLNRYRYTAKGRQKLKTSLAYPREICSTIFNRKNNTNPEMYELFAVTIHDGDNAECGHYYDLVKSPFNQKWYRYDDANVEVLAKPPGTEKPTTMTDGKRNKDKMKPAADQKACYGLLYRKKESVQPVPRPKFPPEELVAESRKQIEESFEGQTKRNMEKCEKRLYDVQRRTDKLKNTLSKLETYESKFKHPNEVAFIPTSLLVNVLQQEYEVAKGEKKEQHNGVEEEGKETNGTVEHEQLNTSITDESIVEAPAEAEKSANDMDLLALAMTSSELPTLPVNENRARTRAQNGISKSVFGYKSSPKKRPLSAKQTVSTRVANRLESHEMSLCLHGKMSIEPILYGDVKAVSRSPAIMFLREYDFKVKIERDDGKKEYPLPEKDKEIYVLTAEDICMECVREMRRDGIFKGRLDDDERMVKKILKEEKIRCSVKGLKAKPEDHFYVAKIALSNFKKNAELAREHRLQQTPSNGGTLFYESTLSQKEDSTFLSLPSYKQIRCKSRRSLHDGSEPSAKMAKNADESSQSLNSTLTDVEGFPEQILEEYDPSGIVESLVEKVAQAIEMEENENTRSSGSTCGNELSSWTRSPTSSSPVEFNSELRCPHGGVNFNQFRHSVSPDEWSRLQYYFDSCFAVRVTDEVCETCRQDEVDAQTGSENMRILVREMRKRLTDVLKKVESRQTNYDKMNETIEFGVCSAFMDKLKKLSTRNATTPPPICQSCLFCEHAAPFKGFYNKNYEPDSYMVGLTKNEWNTIVKEIESLQNVESSPEIPEQPKTIRIKSGEIENFCEACNSSYLQFREDQKYIFDNENVMVRLISPVEVEEEEPQRSSKLTRRKKNVHAVKMSSSSRLMDLKVALYQKCCQAPNDQILYRTVGGEALDANCNSKTLFELRISPNNIENPLILIANPQVISQNTNEERMEQRAPERGFVDTALAH